MESASPLDLKEVADPGIPDGDVGVDVARRFVDRVGLGSTQEERRSEREF
jgi:hypothetical protein